jgi:hypothetical protein
VSSAIRRLERLCALVPKPRKHLVTYHGVLAPAAGLRSQVVPKPKRVEADGESVDGCSHGTGGAATAVPAPVAVNGEDAAFRRRKLQRGIDGMRGQASKRGALRSPSAMSSIGSTEAGRDECYGPGRGLMVAKVP